jgi:hypothetical protein
MHHDADSTTVQFPGYRAKSHRFITPESAAHHREEHTTVKTLPDPLEPHKPFDAKLMAVACADGSCLPFVMALENKSLPTNTFRAFPLNGFSSDGKSLGYVVVTSSLHDSTMDQVFDWYFKTVVLPHFDKLTPEADGTPPMCLFTFDGETSQLAALTEEMLKAFVNKQVIVMKLPAAFSAIGQPLDVSVCFREFKRLIKAGRFYGKISPYLQVSFEALQDALSADTTAASWADGFLLQLEHALYCAARVLHIAFGYPNVMKTFEMMGWCPSNFETIIRRTKYITEDDVQQCLDAWPRLLERSK